MKFLYINPLVVLIFCFSFTVSAVDYDPTKPLIKISSKQDKVFKKTTKQNNKKRRNPLSAIFIKQGHHQAIINNHLYQSGDTVLGKKIVSINANTVLLKNRQGILKLTLIQSVKKNSRY